VTSHWFVRALAAVGRRRAAVLLLQAAQLFVAAGTVCAQGQINSSFMRTGPRFVPSPVMESPAVEFYAPSAAEPRIVPINADYSGRAAVFANSTRMADFAGGSFLPAAIPVAGQPFFDSPWRAGLQGDGSTVGLGAAAEVDEDLVVSGYAKLLVRNATVSFSGDDAGAALAINQAYAQINRLGAGVAETAFADFTSVPETIDLAGPNARVTVQPAGLGETQGRLSYYFFSDGDRTGFTLTTSVEQPLPFIETGTDTGTYSRYPDFVNALYYTMGDGEGDGYVELWHVQLASVIRSLGLEDETNTFDQTVFGWGLSLTGAFWGIPNGTPDNDGVLFGVTYGHGVSHYISDLNDADDTFDAVVNTSGQLVALPVLAWYLGYTHHWTDTLRSTATYSNVSLDSVVPLGGAYSPYRTGQMAAINLLYHIPGGVGPQDFYTGVEYLYGHKQTLDSATGEAHRVMWVVAVGGGSGSGG
jgi:hypothetical protein